jgi:hypothetical protein
MLGGKVAGNWVSQVMPSEVGVVEEYLMKSEPYLETLTGKSTCLHLHKYKFN